MATQNSNSSETEQTNEEQTHEKEMQWTYRSGAVNSKLLGVKTLVYCVVAVFYFIIFF